MPFHLDWRGFVAACSATLLSGCATAEAASSERHLFYLHGRIIEDQGPSAVSERFGSYDYAGILATFRESGLRVVSETRPRDTDVGAYADTVVAQVEALIERGVPPSHITVVGASKGAVIASLVSTRLRNPRVRYVLMGTCNDWLVERYDPRLTGVVLSIHEQSDELVGSCQSVAARSPDVTRFEEIRLETGLAHGFLYQPMPEWMTPAVAWATR